MYVLSKYQLDMFEDIPDDVPEQYVSGAAAFVLSGGERHDNMSQSDYAFVLNELTGHARVATGDDDQRATQKLVPKGEVDDGEALAPDEYSSNTLGAEARAWAQWVMDHSDYDPSDDE